MRETNDPRLLSKKTTGENREKGPESFKTRNLAGRITLTATKKHLPPRTQQPYPWNAEMPNYAKERTTSSSLNGDRGKTTPTPHGKAQRRGRKQQRESGGVEGKAAKIKPQW